MNRSFRIILVICILIILAALNGRAQTDPGTADTLGFETTIAYLDRDAVLPIHLFNDEALAFLEMTIGFQSDFMQFDSVSFTGTRFEGTLQQEVVTVLNDTAFTVFLFSSLAQGWPAGSGVIAKAHFSFGPGVVPHAVPLDTVLVSGVSVDHSTLLWTTDLPAIEFKPKVVPGLIDVQEPPVTMDSLWVSDIEVEPGESFAVELGLFNELPTKDVTVSLNYSEPVLTFDSVSLANTRRPTAGFSVTPNTSLRRLRLDLDFTDGNPLVAGSGTIARVYYTVNGDSPDVDVIFDTTAFQPTFLTLSSSAGGLQYTPGFHKGTVTVRRAVDVEEPGDGTTLPRSFALAQNYPNPFNPTTVIDFSLPRAGWVSLDVYNVLGRKVRNLVDEYLPAGNHRVEFDGRSADGGSLASGVYLYRLVTGNFSDSRKMILIK
jgi:hypothetical protein